MSDETVFHTEVRSALQRDLVPPVDLAAIYARAPQVRRPQLPARRIGAITAAALAAVLLASPGARAVAANVEAHIVSVLWSITGKSAGPRVPASILQKLKTQTHEADVRRAAKDVPFALVVPSGLPPDVRARTIVVSPTAHWSAKRPRTWGVSQNVVTFRYTRSNGQAFELQASQYDPADAVYAYMWETVDKPNGEPVVVHGKIQLIRHDWLHWRNGSQVTSAVIGPGLNMAEAQAIRAAMNGVELPGIKTKGPHGGKRLMVITVRGR